MSEMKVLIFFLTGLYIVIFMKDCNNTHQKTEINFDVLKNESVDSLQAILQKQSEWVKVHAAEFLLELGFSKDVQEIYLNEERQFGTNSPYRIGIWRVLSKAAKKSDEKKVWTDKILEAFLDTTGVDRIHAAETLAKLSISPLTENPQITEKTLNSQIRSLSLYTQWSIAFSSNELLQNARKSFLDLAVSENEDTSSRRLAAYVVRHLGGLTPSEWEVLAQSSLAEPEESELKISLLSATIITASKEVVSSDLYNHIYRSFLRFKNISRKNIRIEIAAGLAEKGTLEDLPVLISFLKNENPLGTDSYDADVRASAAFAILKIRDRQLRAN